MPQMHPFFIYPGAQVMQNAGFLHTAYGATAPPAMPVGNDQLPINLKYPDLIYWFTSLDTNEERNKDGIDDIKAGRLAFP